MKKISLIMAILILLVISCKVENIESNVPIVLEPDLPLTVEQDSFFAALPNKEVKIKDIILPNRQKADSFLKLYLQKVKSRNGRIAANADDIFDLNPNSEEWKNVLIGRFIQEAIYLADDNNFSGYNQTSGIAYSFGSKDHTILQRPEQSGCPAVHGLDCSGFIYNVVKSMNIKGFPAGGSKDQSKTETWNTCFEKDDVDEIKHLKMVDLGLDFDFKNLQSGDIIFWQKPSVNHVAMAGEISENNTKRIVIFMSNGKTGKQNTETECKKNLSKDRGVRCVEIDDMYWSNTKSSGQHGVLRIMADFSGKWNLTLRCKSDTTKKISILLDIPYNSKLSVDSNTVIPISGSGLGTNFDNTNLEATIAGTFTPKERKLDVTITIKGAGGISRKDTFSTIIETYHTDYFNCQLSAGPPTFSCPLEGRLTYRSN